MWQLRNIFGHRERHLSQLKIKRNQNDHCQSWMTSNLVNLQSISPKIQYVSIVIFTSFILEPEIKSSEQPSSECNHLAIIKVCQNNCEKLTIDPFHLSLEWEKVGIFWISWSGNKDSFCSYFQTIFAFSSSLAIDNSVFWAIHKSLQFGMNEFESGRSVQSLPNALIKKSTIFIRVKI
jgi:hypothetical protein